MNSTSTRDRRENFYRLYASLFGRLSEADGLDMYFAWFDTVDSEVAFAALNALGIAWRKDRKPRLGDIKRAYREEMHAKREAVGSSCARGVNDGTDCGFCGGKGYGYVVVGFDREGRSFFVVDSSRRFVRYEVREHPCCNGMGTNHFEAVERVFGTPKSIDGWRRVNLALVSGARKWFSDRRAAMGFMEECGVIDSAEAN